MPWLSVTVPSRSETGKGWEKSKVFWMSLCHETASRRHDWNQNKFHSGEVLKAVRCDFLAG